MGFLKGIEEEYLVGLFFNGLKEEIKAEVKLYEPDTLADLMLKAQMVEDKIRVNSKGGSSSVARPTASYKPYTITKSLSRGTGGSGDRSISMKEKEKLWRQPVW